MKASIRPHTLRIRGHLDDRFITHRAAFSTKLLLENIDGFCITHLPNIRYLTGFTGSNALLFWKNNRYIFFTDGRYEEQAHHEVDVDKIIIVKNHSLIEELVRQKDFRSATRMFFEKEYISFAVYEHLRSFFRAGACLGIADCIEELREVKSHEELDRIEQAVIISDRVFSDILHLIKPGATEIDLASEITHRQRMYGAERDAFPPIVLCGKRTSLVHGQPASVQLKNGDIILFDFGCVVDGYHSDMTRMVALGSVSRTIKKIHAVVWEARNEALASVKADIDAKGIDAAARRTIARAGYSKQFVHSTGHGIGLEVHESPRVSAKSKQRLKENTVITIEPGIYIPQIGGVRIEDLVLVLENGALPLTHAPHEIIVL